MKQSKDKIRQKKRCTACKRWEVKPTDEFCGFCGIFLSPLEISPRQVILVPGMGEKRSVVFKNKGAKRLRVSIKENPGTQKNQYLEFVPLPYFEIEPNSQHALVIRLKEKSPPQGLTANTKVKTFSYVCTLDNNKNKQTRLPITIKLPPIPTAVTDTVHLDNDGKGTAAITNEGGIPLNISSIEIQNGDGWHVSPSPPLPPVNPGKIFSIDIQAPGGNNRAPAIINHPELRIGFKNASNHLSIPVHGPMDPSGLGVSPAAVQIGDALSKEHRFQSFTVVNNSGKTIEITHITSSEPDWLTIPDRYFPLTLTVKQNTGEFHAELSLAHLRAGKHNAKIKIQPGGDLPALEIDFFINVIHPSGQGETIGIDFGTSNSVVAMWHEGKIRLVVDKKTGSPLIPSVLVFQGHPGHYVIGSEAETLSSLYPGTAVRSIKGVMGYGKGRTFFNMEFQPDDLASLVLKKLVEYAERCRFRLYGNRPQGYLETGKAIITVPSEFYDVQVRGILQACEKAGIDTQEKDSVEAAGELKKLTGHDIDESIILDEPTAAALFYLHLFQENGTFEKVFEPRIDNGGSVHLLIYDYGGGTLDVSIVEIFRLRGGDIGVRALADKGDNRIGGERIDLEIMNRLLNLYSQIFSNDGEKQQGLDPALISMNFNRLDDLRQRENWSEKKWTGILEARHQWKKAAEHLKIRLSTEETVLFEMSSGVMNSGGNDFKTTVTQDILTHWVGEILEKSGRVVRDVLKLAGIEDKKIDYIIHTGRSSLMPQVRAFLRDELPMVPPGHDILYPEHLKVCVAKGAVLFARLRSQVCVDQGVRIVDGGRKLPHSYGIQVNKGFKQLFEPIIERGATYPVEISKKFPAVPGRPMVNIRFLRNSGTGTTITGNNDIREIGSMTIDTRKINGGNNRTKDEVNDYVVTFKIDANRKIEVTAGNEPMEIRPCQLTDEEQWNY